MEEKISRIRVANKKTGQKSLNAFLWYLKLKNITDYKITVDLSKRKRNQKVKKRVC
jgi:hypothetical protein